MGESLSTWTPSCNGAARGMTPLVQDRPSQATLSRLLNCLGRNDNIDVVHEGLPIEVHGHQGGSAITAAWTAAIDSKEL